MRREEAAVPPILPAANEEGLDTHLPRRTGQRENVGVAEPLGVNRLATLDIGQRAQPVAIHRRKLIILRLGRLGHRLAEPRLNAGRLAAQEILRILDQLGIGGLLDPPDARRRTTPDLIQQAGPRSVGEKAVRTTA